MAGDAIDRPAARAVILTPDAQVLLMRFRFPWRDQDLWITPGGGLAAGEDARSAVIREIHEETGLRDATLSAELWTREHHIHIEGKTFYQRERYFLVRTPRFEPEALALESGNEADWFEGFGWWSIADLPEVGETFAPTGLGRLLRDLVNEGVPDAPFRIGV